MPETRVSATELLMKVLENFGDSEARDLMIIFNDEDGNVSWHSNTDLISREIGLLEFTKAVILKRALE